MTEEKKTPELKKLVLWKLDAEVPYGIDISIGNKGTFSKEELKKHIEKEDEIGKTYIKMQLKFMKSLFSGELSKILAE